MTTLRGIAEELAVKAIRQDDEGFLLYIKASRAIMLAIDRVGNVDIGCLGDFQKVWRAHIGDWDFRYRDVVPDMVIPVHIGDAGFAEAFGKQSDIVAEIVWGWIR